MESASSGIGLKFSSRVISDSNMFMALLRVEIVFEAYMSRLLTLASPPKTRLPPVLGQVKAAVPLAARAGTAAGCGAAGSAGVGGATGAGAAGCAGAGVAG